MELDPFIADIKRGLFEALNAQIDDYSVEIDMKIDLIAVLDISRNYSKMNCMENGCFILL